VCMWGVVGEGMSVLTQFLSDFFQTSIPKNPKK